MGRFAVKNKLLPCLVPRIRSTCTLFVKVIVLIFNDWLTLCSGWDFGGLILVQGIFCGFASSPRDIFFRL